MNVHVLFLTLFGVGCAAFGAVAATCIMYLSATPSDGPDPGPAISPDAQPGWEPKPDDQITRWTRPDPTRSSAPHLVPFLDGWLTDRLLRTDRWAAQAAWHIADWHDQARANADAVDDWLARQAVPVAAAAATP